MLYLVMGGAAQGKTAYAETLFDGLPYDVRKAGDALLDVEAANLLLLDFETLVPELPETGWEDALDAWLAPLEERFGLLVVTMREMGAGVVPLDPEARRFRERSGRVLCHLAERACRVDRVFAGSGILLKEDRCDS